MAAAATPADGGNVRPIGPCGFERHPLVPQQTEAELLSEESMCASVLCTLTRRLRPHSKFAPLFTTSGGYLTGEWEKRRRQILEEEMSEEEINKILKEAEI